MNISEYPDGGEQPTCNNNNKSAPACQPRAGPVACGTQAVGCYKLQIVHTVVHYLCLVPCALCLVLDEDEKTRPPSCQAEAKSRKGSKRKSTTSISTFTLLLSSSIFFFFRRCGFCRWEMMRELVACRLSLVALLAYDLRLATAELTFLLSIIISICFNHSTTTYVYRGLKPSINSLEICRNLERK